jgi:hypothetical protein
MASIELKKVMIPTSMDPFVVEVNGLKYEYPAGTEQDVPEEVAAVIDNIEQMTPRPDGGSGGAGAGMMVVNITSNEDYSAFYSDKTVHEILEATKAGMIVKAVAAEQDGYYIGDLAYVDTEMAQFSGIAAYPNGMARITAFSIFNDGYVEAVNGVISIGSGK